MNQTPPRGFRQDGRTSHSPRSSAVDPADLTPDSRIRCRICERTTYAIGVMVTTGGLLDRKSVLMVLTDAEGDDSPERVIDRAICRPCATQLDGELARNQPLLEVLVSALLREWRRQNTNGHLPPAPRLVAAVSQAAVKEYKPSSIPPASEDEVLAYLADNRVFNSASDVENNTDNVDIEEDVVDTEDDQEEASGPTIWGRTVHIARRTLAAGVRIGASHWSIDQSWKL